MSDLIRFFFPNSNYMLIAGLGYLLIFMTTYKRYNTLIMNFGTYDAPETARPWTTLVRYHSSAVIYACLYAVLFAVVYQLFLQCPVLAKLLANFVGLGDAYKELITTLGNDINLVSPILALILLTWGAEKIRRITTVDRHLRNFFQRLGSIPAAVSKTIRKLKKYEFTVTTDQCLDEFSPQIKEEIMLPLLQKDPKSLEHMFLRACHLVHQIDDWSSVDSDFFQFQTVYSQALRNIRTRFEKMKRNASRYYQLKLNFAGEAPIPARSPEDMASPRFDNMYPKILTELRKDFKNDLKLILENIYVYIACAVHNKGFTAKKRNKMLRAIGFKIDNGHTVNGDAMDPNDLTILGVFLLFVIPLSAIFARILGNHTVGHIQSLTYVVWTVMAVFIGIASVKIPVLFKAAKEISDHPFWKRIRPTEGHAWFAYMLSATAAGITGILGIFLLNFLSPEQNTGPVMETLIRIVPWGLVPMAVAFVLGYHLDRRSKPNQRTRVMEAASTALFAMLAAVVALILNAQIIDWNQLITKMYFSVTCAMLFGSVIGAVVPNRYRRRQHPGTGVVPKNINLKKTIVDCITAFSQRAEKENVRITAMVADDIPVLKIDPGKIKQAINGLISNALEFTPAEGEIHVTAAMGDDGRVQFAVKDNGIGMSRFKIKNIVDASPEALNTAWEQVDGQLEADLIQVRAIVEKHGGKLNLSSRQWEGTEVVIELPGELISRDQTTASGSKNIPADLAA